MEGVAFSARLALEALEASGALRPAMLQAGGGGMQADRWCQIRADALGRPLRRMSARHAAALGAAVCAGVGCGAMASLAEAAKGLVREDRVFAPDREAAALAEDRFATFGETLPPAAADQRETSPSQMASRFPAGIQPWFSPYFPGCETTSHGNRPKAHSGPLPTRFGVGRDPARRAAEGLRGGGGRGCVGPPLEYRCGGAGKNQRRVRVASISGSSGRERGASASRG